MGAEKRTAIDEPGPIPETPSAGTSVVTASPAATVVRWITTGAPSSVPPVSTALAPMVIV